MLNEINGNFTQIPNEIIFNENLSAKAKWILIYLISKPKNWDFSVHRIKYDFKDWVDSIISWINEIEENGFLERKKMNNWKVVYIINWIPKTKEFLKAKKPDWEKHNLEKSQTGKIHTIINKEKIINTKKLKNKENIYIWFFEDFWELYPKKVWKQKAQKAFMELEIDDMKYEKIISWVKSYSAYLNHFWRQKDFILNPEKFLKEERWSDDFSFEDGLLAYERENNENINFFEGLL